MGQHSSGLSNGLPEVGDCRCGSVGVPVSVNVPDVVALCSEQRVARCCASMITRERYAARIDCF